MLRSAFRAACALLFASALSWAQLTTTTIFGTVTDSSGGLIPGVHVTAVNVDTSLSRSVQSNAQGEYRIEFLPIGNYRVDITANGFEKFSQQGIVAQLDQASRVDATLQVGSATETISVTTATPLVNTNDAAIGRTVENREILQLPLLDRNVYTLLNLTAGVDNTTTDNTLGIPAQSTVVNGSADNGSGSVNYYLDGGTAMTGVRNTGNILPNPDAVDEFRVITNNFSAEYGRFAGGIVNVVTKSGSNAFHGSLFEFFRNDVLNANPWGSSTKPSLRRNQFGGAAGRRIVKNKLFFFGSYQGVRQVTNQFFNDAVVPTPLERMGDFS